MKIEPPGGGPVGDFQTFLSLCLARVMFLSRLFTALNLLPPMTISAWVKRFRRRLD